MSTLVDWDDDDWQPELDDERCGCCGDLSHRIDGELTCFSCDLDWDAS